MRATKSIDSSLLLQIMWSFLSLLWTSHQHLRSANFKEGFSFNRQLKFKQFICANISTLRHCSKICNRCYFTGGIDSGGLCRVHTMHGLRVTFAVNSRVPGSCSIITTVRGDPLCRRQDMDLKDCAEVWVKIDRACGLSRCKNAL